MVIRAAGKVGGPDPDRVRSKSKSRKYRQEPARGRAKQVGVAAVVKVSSKSNPNMVAGALAGILREHGAVDVQTVGAGALNQAIKAVAIARGYLAESGHDASCRPRFTEIEIDGEARTAIRLFVEITSPPPAGAAGGGTDGVIPLDVHRTQSVIAVLRP